MPSTFNLGDRYDQLLDNMVATGDYSNKSEVMRDALRLLERDRIKWCDILDGHRAALADSTPTLSRDDALARIRSRQVKTEDQSEPVPPNRPSNVKS